MKGRLQDKVALVTGGGSGIGRGAAIVFAREGAKVVVADIAVEAGEETVQKIRQGQGDAVFVKADVAKAEDVIDMVNKAVETYGQLNCAFNNAGAGAFPFSIADGTEDKWDLIMNVNLKGVWLCMKYEIIYMVAHGGGAIVNTSSAAGVTSSPMNAAYTASKHGVVGLTKAAALEYAKAGIRVNAVCPRLIYPTGMTEPALKPYPEMLAKAIGEVPLGRVGTPEDVGEAVAWLCSDAAGYITGDTLLVEGGILSGGGGP